MHVVHICPVFPPYRGGMGTVAWHEARALAAAGVRITVLTPAATSPPEQPPGVEVLALRPALRRGNAAWLPRLPAHLPSCDVIELHYPCFGAAEPLLLRRRRSLPPVVLRYQMDVVGAGWLRAVFALHARLVFPRILNASAAVLVTSLDYARHSTFLGPRLPSLGQRLHEVPGGVDLERFRPSDRSAEIRHRHAIPDRAPLAFCLAALDRAHYFKGIPVLLEAMARLPDHHLIVGGDGDLRPAYERQARSLGIAPRVRFAGGIPEDDLAAYFTSADVTVLPSTDRTEAFGLVLLESMACGTPVVASSLPGVRTLVMHGETGFLVPPGDAFALAAAIREAAVHSSELGRCARERVAMRYGWDQVARRLIDVYREVIDRRQKNR